MMHFFPAPLSSLASIVLFTYARASYLHNELSFGHQDRISPNLRGIPNWHLVGKPDPPEILSNKIVLTPPVPGNQRGAIWAQKSLEHSLWTADIDFRATGPERGGGNLQIWYAKNGLNDIGTSSIYTVGKFDGLALVIDQYAGSGGYIRGFLNDGSTDYKSHHSVDSLAFGHCEYSYRNLGRPSRIAIQQSKEQFVVSVDGTICFATKKVRVPLGNSFGISAASAENPDSFEVFKFVTTTESHTPDAEQHNVVNQETFAAAADPKGAQAQKKDQVPANQQQGDIPTYSDPLEAPASQFASSSEQFADLHNRLQAMMKHITTLNRDHQIYQTQSQHRHDELMKKLGSMEEKVSRVKELQDKLDDVQKDVRLTKADIHNQIDGHVAGLKSEVKYTHANLNETMEGMGTGWGKFLMIVVASQVVSVGAYMLYKKRKNANNHQKYL